MEAASRVMSASLQSKGRKGLAWEAAEEYVVSCHVVEGCVIKYVGMTYDG